MRRVAVAGAILGAAFVPLLIWAQAKLDPRAVRARENERIYGFNRVISGRVTYDNGQPAAGFLVSAKFEHGMTGKHQPGSPGEGDAITDANGRYEIRGLAPDRFLVSVNNGGKPWVVPPQVPVDLNLAKSARGIDGVLRQGPVITIRVRDAETGRPVSGLVADVGFPSGPRPFGPTDGRGEIHFRSGELGLNLQLRDPDPRRRYNAAPGSSFFREIHLPEPKDVTWEVLAYEGGSDRRPATFRGTAVDPSGTPIAGVHVRLIRNGESKEAITDAGGSFSFQTQRILPYEGESEGAVLLADKGNLSVTKRPSAAETWGTIRLVLVPNAKATLVGQIVDASGRPLPGCAITYWEFISGGGQGTVQPVNGGNADANGKFVLGGLRPEASYHLRFGGAYSGGMAGTTLLPVMWKRDKQLSLKAHERRDLGKIVVPIADASIAGTVVNAAGRRVTKDVILTLEGKHTQLSALPDAQGKFEFTGVVREPLTLRGFSGSDGAYRTANDSPDLLTKRKVEAGERGVVVRL